MSSEYLSKVIDSIKGKDIGVFTDILNAQHILLISINDEGDFVAFPMLFSNCNPEHEPDINKIIH